MQDHIKSNNINTTQKDISQEKNKDFTQMPPERGFKGIWIPAHIWTDQRLTYFERCLLAEINSLDGEYGCWASNEYFCKFFNENERTIQRGLAKLKKLGYIYQERFDGRSRFLRSNLNPQNDNNIFDTTGVSNLSPRPLTKMSPLSYIYNKEEKLSVVAPPPGTNSEVYSNNDLPRCKDPDPQKIETPNFISKIRILTAPGREIELDPSEMFFRACKEQKPWLMAEMQAAWEILSQCKNIINDWWRFIEGTIKNLRQKQKSDDIAKGKYSWNNKKNSQNKKPMCEKESEKPSEQNTKTPTSRTTRSIQSWLEEYQSGSQIPVGS